MKRPVWCEGIKALFLLFLTLPGYLGYSQDSSSVSPYRLKIGDLNYGIDTRYLNTLQDSAAKTYYTTYTGGLSFRYQSSLVFNYVYASSEKRFRIGDLLSGEISAGAMQSNDPVQKIPFWFAYRFEMGMATIYRISKNTEIGLNLILLRFARDYVTQNFSGSALDLRCRLHRVIVEGGIDNRVLRIFGYIANANDETNMRHLGFRYLLRPDRNIGFRLEWLNKIHSANEDGVYNLRVYWGRIF